jgi:polynucleotide 5'-kinase involved in rRNA processing
MSSPIQKKEESELNNNNNNNNEKNTNNEEEEKKPEELTKKYKSKFSLLDQGRIMLIGNIEELTKNIIIIGPKGSGKSSVFSLLTTGTPNLYTDNGTC